MRFLIMVLSITAVMALNLPQRSEPEEFLIKCSLKQQDSPNACLLEFLEKYPIFDDTKQRVDVKQAIQDFVKNAKKVDLHKFFNLCLTFSYDAYETYKKSKSMPQTLFSLQFQAICELLIRELN